MSALIRNLSVHYIPGVPVLRSVNLEARPGEVTTVLGESGSGKTTLLRVLAGLHPASSGEIVLGGQDITRVPVERRGVGLVPQEGALFHHLTVAANIAYGLRGMGRRAAAKHPRIHELLALVGLEGLEERMPHELSGGQQQRVALARALAPEPRMLLLDEPFSALDPSLRTRVREEVFAILREQNLPTLLITHDQQEALSCSDQVAVLRNGHVVQSGTPRELYMSPADVWVASFVGDACILPALGASEGDEVRLRTPVGEVSSRGDCDRRGRSAVLVRPENVAIRACEGGDGVQPCITHAVHGRVCAVRFMGHCQLVDINLREGGEEYTVMARVGADEEVPALGSLVCVEVGCALHTVVD